MEDDDFALSHQTSPEVKMIQEMVGCSHVDAWKAYMRHKQDAVAAIDELMTKPVVSGEKYIPKKPTVDSEMTDEQKNRCTKGRWLQDQVNAVFSVAHSKTLHAPAAEEVQPSAEQSVEVPQTVTSAPQLPSTTS